MNNLKENKLRILLSLKCNYKCSYCTVDYKNDFIQHKNLEVDQWLKFLNETDFSGKFEGNYTIVFTGGEPTLYKDFFELIENIKHKNIFIYTNMSHAAYRKIMKLKKKIGLYPSFHAEEEYRINGEYAFKAWYKRLLDIKKKGHDLWCPHVPNTDSPYVRSLPAFLERTNIEGTLNGVFHSHYMNQCRVDKKEYRKVKCFTSDFIIDPMGDIFNCQGNLFRFGGEKLGNIGNYDFGKMPNFVDCYKCGGCHMCSQGKIILDENGNMIKDKWQYLHLLHEGNPDLPGYPTNIELRGKLNQ